MNSTHNLHGLIQLFETFRNLINETYKDSSENVFLQKEVEPWHHYYEMSKYQLISTFLETANLQSEALKYIFSNSPIQTAIDIANQDGPKNPPSMENLETILSILYAVIKNYESVFYNNKTIIQLVGKIKDGHDPNDNLLQKLLLIDKTAINLPVIQSRLHEAQLNNDKTLFNKLSNTFKPRRQPKQVEDSELMIIIFFLMDCGELQKMSEKEKVQTLHKYKSPYISDSSFSRKIYRIMNIYY